MEEKETNAIWEPTERQTRFLICPADEVLYGGAASGGKSESLIAFAIGDAEQNIFNNRNWKSLLLRRTSPELERTLIQRSHYFLDGRAKYDQVKKRWVTPIGGRMEFGHMEYEKNKYDYKSSEYNRIGFDEVTEFSETMYTYMFSRNRTSDPHLKCQMRCASNPGGIGHGWVKSRFISNEDGSFKKPDYVYTYDVFIPGGPGGRKAENRVMTRAFIPAKLIDNPYVDRDYAVKLEMLPDVEKRALRDGDWNIYSGQFFTEFSPEHICKPFEFAGWPVWISMDWGFRTWCAVGFYAQDPMTKVVYMFDEIYHSKVSARDTAILIKEKLGRHFVDLVGLYADKRIELTDERIGGISTRQKFADEGVYFTQANHDRVPGWHRTRELLMKDEFGDVKFQVFDTCVNFINKIPEAIHDMHNPDDMDKNGENHMADQFRYFSIMRHVDGREVERDIMSYHPKTGYPCMSDNDSDIVARLVIHQPIRMFMAKDMGISRE